MRHLAAEELGRIQRGLVHHHGHALGLDALHDALHARRTEVVGTRLHRKAVHAHHRRGRAGVDELRHLGKHLVGDEVLARAVGVDDGLDQVLDALWDDPKGMPNHMKRLTLTGLSPKSDRQLTNAYPSCQASVLQLYSLHVLRRRSQSHR